MLNVRKFQVRFPVDLKEWIEMEAFQNGSSQNSEIIRAVRECAIRRDKMLTAVEDLPAFAAQLARKLT